MMTEAKNMGEGFTKFDIAAHLNTESDIIGYLEALLEEGDAGAFAAGLAYAARARGTSHIPLDAGVRHESLFLALSAEGNPEFATVLKAMKALGLKLVPMAV